MKMSLKYKTIIAITISLAVVALFSHKALADSSLVISELSMGSSSSATEEFVELYNNSNAFLNLAGYSIYYRSATGSSYTKKATFVSTSSVSPHSFFLVSTFAPNNLALISGMAQTGGVVELRDDKGLVVDRVGYGNATIANGKPAIAVQAGESIYRQYDPATLQMVNTSDNFSDFYVANIVTPGALPVPEVVDISEPITYPNIVINEIYPNPTDDQSESEDEFIELYNPNNFAVDLSGWLLKDSSGKTFIIKGTVVESLGFVSFFSKDTKISLNNTGDIVSLYSPNELKDQTADYGDAKEGLSWGLINGSWSWNNSPTPSSTNSSAYIEVIAVKPTAEKNIKKAEAKKASSKQTVAKKVAAKKAATKKPKAKKLSAAKAQASNSNSPEQPTSQLDSKYSNIWPILLIILGTGTIGYGIYEYRPELTSLYVRAKNKLVSGK